MSSTTSTTPTAVPATRVATTLFTAAVTFFLLAGLLIVLGQSALLTVGDATAAREWADTLAPYAFGGASVAGLLSFALSYGDTPDDPTDDG